MLGNTIKRMTGAVWRWFASTLSNPASWFVEWFKGTQSDSGIQFSKDTALQYPPIWYGVNRIAGHIGIMPLVLYVRKGERERQKATSHPGYRLMKLKPNQWLSPVTLKETLTQHAILWGNGRALILRDGNGQPAEIGGILDPSRTVCVKMRNTELNVTQKYHVYRDEITNKQEVWPDNNVLHIQGLGEDGFQGYSLIEFAKNSMGLGLAAEKAANRFFKNNAVPSLILEAPAGTFRTEEKAQEFLSKFNEYHAGSDNSGKVGMLREGIKATPLSMSGRDAQWIEQRKFQRQEAALWLLLEKILGDDSSVSYNSLEQKNLEYLTSCLLRWLIKWEQECNKKLLTPTQHLNDTHFFKFRTEALMRSTTKERYQVYQIGRQIEVLSANDVRELEDMNPRDGGDEYANPAINIQEPGEDNEDTGSTRAETQLAILQRESGHDIARKLIVTRLRELIRVEVRRVRAVAKNPEKFLDRLDTMYGAFEQRIASVFEGCGSTADVAALYVEESKQRVLDVAGSATPDELVEMIKIDTADWLDRADVWTDKILEGD